MTKVSGTISRLNVSGSISKLGVSGSISNLDVSASIVESGATDTNLMDIDGNIYDTVTINGQEWIVDNYRATRYSDGSDILNLTDNTDWGNDTSGAYVYYNNDSANLAGYGLLYNGNAVDNAGGLVYFTIGGVAQSGWRIPTDDDFAALLVYCGGAAVAGKKLKETGTTYWSLDNGHTDEFGFTARPGGRRLSTGTYQAIRTNGAFWTSTDNTPGSTKWYYDTDLLDDSARLSGSIKSGFSIRCVRDL